MDYDFCAFPNLPKASQTTLERSSAQVLPRLEDWCKTVVVSRREREWESEKS